MAAKKFLRFVNNVITEVFGVQASAGAGNAGDIVALDDTGRIDNSMMPVGIGADTAVIVASETLAAGDWVNVWNDAGTAKARKADATSAGKEVHGFVLAAFSERCERHRVLRRHEHAGVRPDPGLPCSSRPLRALAARRHRAHPAMWFSRLVWPCLPRP